MSRRFRVYVPLQKFHCDRDHWDVAPGIRVERFHELSSLQGLESKLAPSEREGLTSEASHWLLFTVEDQDPATASEVMNMLLLALWIVRPTRTRASFRFEIGVDDAQGTTTVTRLLDRFQWSKGCSEESFSDEELEDASLLYASMEKMSPSGRLNNALVLTLDSCFQGRWQSALVLAASAAEAILTFSTKPGLTSRLATSFACLLKSDQSSRDAVYSEFVACYKVRSDVAHGRGMGVPQYDRIPLLVRWQGILRALWRHVLTDTAVFSALEGTDAQREAFFSGVNAGYKSP